MVEFFLRSLWKEPGRGTNSLAGCRICPITESYRCLLLYQFVRKHGGTRCVSQASEPTHVSRVLHVCYAIILPLVLY